MWVFLWMEVTGVRRIIRPAKDVGSNRMDHHLAQSGNSLSNGKNREVSADSGVAVHYDFLFKKCYRQFVYYQQVIYRGVR